MAGSFQGGLAGPGSPPALTWTCAGIWGTLWAEVSNHNADGWDSETPRIPAIVAFRSA
jgi:hypothetical protein